MPSTTLAAVLLATLATGCANTTNGDNMNPPAGHCVSHRATISMAGGQPQTVQTCQLWYFGPSREQDMRFRKAGGL